MATNANIFFFSSIQVLGLLPTATQSDITNAWRLLSKENHPDKVKDESLKRAAQEKFMEIQQAYEVLSKIKNARRRRNKRDNADL